jgi:hypothetical protein
MLSTEHSGLLDKIWQFYWPATDLKPLTVVDSLNSLLFIKQLDESASEKEKNTVPGTPENLVVKPEEQNFRWSSFQHKDPESLYELFTGKPGVLDFAKAHPAYSRMERFGKEDRILIPPRDILAKIIALINQLGPIDNTVRTEMVDYLVQKSQAPKKTKDTEFEPVREEKIPEKKARHSVTTHKSKVSKSIYKVLAFVFLGALAVALLYFNWKTPTRRTENISSPGLAKNIKQNDSLTSSTPVNADLKKDTVFGAKQIETTNIASSRKDTIATTNASPPKDTITTVSKKVPVTIAATSTSKKADAEPTSIPVERLKELPEVQTERNEKAPETAINSKGRYKIAGKAYFHDEPDESTRRNAFVIHWNNSYATLEALDETTNFIYVEFRNHKKQVSKGWLRKKDLIPLD